jgi:hypothetical protein
MKDNATTKKDIIVLNGSKKPPLSSIDRPGLLFLLVVVVEDKKSMSSPTVVSKKDIIEVDLVLESPLPVPQPLLTSDLAQSPSDTGCGSIQVQSVLSTPYVVPGSRFVDR